MATIHATVFYRLKEENNMLKDFISKLTKLIDVKSIMTLSLTIGFLFLTGIGQITNDQYLDIFKMIVCFYFGVQSAKKS